MISATRTLAAALLVATAIPALATPMHRHAHRHVVRGTGQDEQLRISQDPAQYSNGHGTNVANSEPATPITPYGGYVVNQYGYGNYVSGPLGYAGYPANSGEAQYLRQRERFKCEYAPETC
jgi:hypothetical protein